ncbi:MAG: membrane protein insertion efficiency factor YidD, partial [Duncaniella sp.]|nr:membrane protein insertion efficiency factor YidD [Duncaniella sp.]
MPSASSWLRLTVSHIILLPVYFYRLCISPMLPPACRFTPTCSKYAVP